MIDLGSRRELFVDDYLTDRIATEDEVETAMEFVRRAYEMIGG